MNRREYTATLSTLALSVAGCLDSDQADPTDETEDSTVNTTPDEDSEPESDTDDTDDLFAKRPDAEPVFHWTDDSRSRIRPTLITNRLLYRDEYVSDARSVDDWSTYESNGYLVVFNVTPDMGTDTDDVLSVDDLAFDVGSFDLEEYRLLREELPDAGAFAHPSGEYTLIEPSEEMDYYRPSGVVVEVPAFALFLYYGIESSTGGVAGLSLDLPAYAEHFGDVEIDSGQKDGEGDES